MNGTRAKVKDSVFSTFESDFLLKSVRLTQFTETAKLLAKKLTSLSHRTLVALVAGFLLVSIGRAPIPSFMDVYTLSLKDLYPVPMNSVLPIYPVAMLEGSQYGQVSLAFDINQQGNVEKPVVFHATPPGVFELTALHAVNRLKYAPKSLLEYPQNTISRDPLRLEGVKSFWFRATVDFPPDILVPSPTFPEPALASGITEGLVTVEFEWENTGKKTKFLVRSDSGEVKDTEIRWVFAPTNPKVVFAEPKNVFEESALEAILKVRRYFHPWLNSSDPPTPPDSDDAMPSLHRYEFSLDSEPNIFVSPTYPEEAIQNEIEGYVVVKFDISTKGRVKNPKVVYSDTPEIFDSAATDTVSRFTYDSRDRVATEVLHLVAFELNKEPELLSSTETIHRNSTYLREATLSNILDWYIDIKFDINESGTVENAKIQDSNAPSRLQQRALRHTRFSKFKPKILNGTPVRAQNFEHRYVVTPEELITIEDISRALELDGFFRKPVYILHADVDGEVIVHFDVDTQGRVNDPVIVESDPAGLYDDFSLTMSKKFQYDPLIVHGSTVPVSNVRHQFFYRDDIDKSASYRIHLDDGSPRF